MTKQNHKKPHCITYRAYALRKLKSDFSNLQSILYYFNAVAMKTPTKVCIYQKKIVILLAKSQERMSDWSTCIKTNQLTRL